MGQRLVIDGGITNSTFQGLFGFLTLGIARIGKALAGMHSRGFDQAWISEDESRVQHFHDWLDVWVEQNPPRFSRTKVAV
jgi:hypothetical protein